MAQINSTNLGKVVSSKSALGDQDVSLLLTYQSPECHKDVFTFPFTLVNDPTISKPVEEKTSEDVEVIGGRVMGALDSEKHESTDNSSPTRVMPEADDISLFTRIIQETQEVIRQAPYLHDAMLWEAVRRINIDYIDCPILKSFLIGAKCDITTRTPEQWMRSLREVGKEKRKINRARYNKRILKLYSPQEEGC